ncbi:hypothetical protein OIU77_029937 [Salix suchowensis]|uniref:Uncharacterized protein n=1 Tax=Salix suchowensis TaxID=1278906 RepID=A0ABQ9BA95_9ROSI|nr:hypothetical protein OIU77_029937 [Salix suchowensis]
MMASALIPTVCILPSQNREVNGYVMSLRSSFYGKVIANRSHMKKETGSIRRDPFVAASVLGRKKTVVPEPDYRIPVVLLGLAGGLAYTNNLLPAAPAALEVKIGEELQGSGENVFVGGKNRWKYSTFVNWELWWPNFPILVYFKETQTKPEGQVHFFPVIFNGKQLYDFEIWCSSINKETDAAPPD